jgi:N-acetylneuraminate synthase
MASDLLKKSHADFAFLHCNSTYPTPFKDVNLGYMGHLKEYSGVIGYSGHERGYHVPIAAVALGAKIIEKHFTFDKSMEGVDHRVSLLPDEFAQMVTCIRDIESTLSKGENTSRPVSQGEIINRENLGKSLVANRSLRAGDTISAADIVIRSPGQGLPPYEKSRLVGSVLRRDVSEGGCFYPSDLPSGVQLKSRRYNFNRPWGVPVRHHDVRSFLKASQPDFIEFHLSYKDMNLNHADFFEKSNDLQFTVHAPELFENDHICDLVSFDKKYLQKSIDYMKRVVEIAVELKHYFPRTKKPFIVATLGGFTTNKPLSAAERLPLYEKMRESLYKIETPEVEILPQSTAPYPWHMGGQQYQNLFLYPGEIADFCKNYSYRICLDISHSYLAINNFNWDPADFFKKVAPYTAHIHVGDCKGVDGEGLQIGDGDIDFKMLSKIFAEKCPEAWFIPEIWQGHKNTGEGFWLALERLEGLL